LWDGEKCSRLKGFERLYQRHYGAYKREHAMASDIILITGAAGFIGMHLTKLLLDRGHRVVGVDNLNDYYSVSLKADRLAKLSEYPGFRFEKIDIADFSAMEALFKKEAPSRVVHLAAQAGVRYATTNPHAYGSANLTGFLNVLECARHHPVRHLIFASSSSVYGSNTQIPFSESHNTDHPLSLYAATKKAGELMAHAYAHLFHIPLTGLRFFTVYGPWGRPDMAPLLFTEAILKGEPINVFNGGEMFRDFTYVDDVVESIYRLMDRPAKPAKDFSTDDPDPATSDAPYQILNIGNHQPVKLLDFISMLEAELGKAAKKNFLPMQPGEVQTTYADVAALHAEIQFQPQTKMREGIRKLVQWYREYYR
jgi:UDP-glucuronate 4-epimerase